MVSLVIFVARRIVFCNESVFSFLILSPMNFFCRGGLHSLSPFSIIYVGWYKALWTFGYILRYLTMNMWDHIEKMCNEYLGIFVECKEYNVSRI